MADMTGQRDVSKILKDFEAAAERYQKKEISLDELSQLKIPTRLSEHVSNVYLAKEQRNATQKLEAEQLSEENTRIVGRALRAMVAGLSDPNIDHAQEMDIMVSQILCQLSSYIPDKFEGIGTFTELCDEKSQIDDIRDPAEKARQLEDLSRRVREAASEYLRSCEAELKS